MRKVGRGHLESKATEREDPSVLIHLAQASPALNLQAASGKTVLPKVRLQAKLYLTPWEIVSLRRDSHKSQASLKMWLQVCNLHGNKLQCKETL